MCEVLAKVAHLEWRIWGPIKGGLASGLTEVLETWTMSDCLDACELLQVQSDLEWLGTEAMKKTLPKGAR